MDLKVGLEALRKAKALVEGIGPRAAELVDDNPEAVAEVSTLGMSLLAIARVKGPESLEYLHHLANHLRAAYILGYEKCERDNAEGGAKCQRR